VADLPQHIDCRRFVRPVGVTGLGAAGTDRAERRPRTVTDEFDGVLATDVRPDSGGPPAKLSYLTLAPLLAQSLGGGRRNGRDPTADARRPRRDDASADEDPKDDDREPTVREVIREDATGTASDRDAAPSDLTITSGPRDRETDRGERSAPADDPSGRGNVDPEMRTGRPGSDREDGGSGPDAPEWVGPDASPADRESDGASGPDRPADLSVTDATRTVIERSSTAAGTDDGDGPAWTVTPETPADTSRSGDQPPTTVARGPDSAESTGGDLRRSPSLTVTRNPAFGSRNQANGDASDAGDAGDAGVPTTSETDSVARDGPAHSPEPGSDAATPDPTRTVIQSDGRVNERVLDRLYEEISRKMRLERTREGH